MEVLAARLRELRAERGLGREKLSRLVDVSTKSIVTWENNAGDPSLENLVKLAQVFGVTPDYLLGLSDDRNPPSAAGSPARPGRSTIVSDSAELAGAKAKRRAAATPRPAVKPRGRKQS